MEMFSALLSLSEGNSPVTGEFPSQRPVTRSFDVFFDLRLSKPSRRRDLRRHRILYDVTVMGVLRIRIYVTEFVIYNKFRYITALIKTSFQK